MTSMQQLLRTCVLAALTATAAAADVTYENTIRQLVDKRCAECHGSDSPSIEEFDKDKEGYKAKKLGPRMDSYEALIVFVKGSDAGALMRRLGDGSNSKDGKPGNMYKRLGKEDADRAANLALFKRWVGSWNLKRVNELAEEEKNAVLAPRN